MSEKLMNELLGNNPTKGKHVHRERGLIYFVEADSLDRIKIGYTGGKFDARLAVIQTGSPVWIRPLLVWKDKTIHDEREIHQRFRDYRQHGEWYIKNDEIMAYIDSIREANPNEVVVWENPKGE